MNAKESEIIHFEKANQKAYQQFQKAQKKSYKQRTKKVDADFDPVREELLAKVTNPKVLNEEAKFNYEMRQL